MSNTMTFDRMTIDGDKNFTEYRRLTHIKYLYIFWYILVSALSMSLSMSGALKSPAPFVLVGLVILCEGIKLWEPTQVIRDNNLIRFIMWSAIIVSFCTSIFACHTHLESGIFEYEKKETSLQQIDEELKMFKARSSNVGSLMTTLNQKNSDLASARLIWMKYRTMKMNDWKKNNSNGRYGRRTGEWMIKNQSKCNTSWCAKVIGYFMKYQAAQKAASTTNLQIQNAQTNKENILALTKSRAAIQASQQMIFSGVWLYIVYAASGLLVSLIESIQHILRVLRSLNHKARDRFYWEKVNFDRKIKVAKRKKAAKVKIEDSSAHIPSNQKLDTGRNMGRINNDTRPMVISRLKELDDGKNITQKTVREIFKSLRLAQNSADINSVISELKPNGLKIPTTI